MRSLVIVKATIEKELVSYSQPLADQFGDDTFVRQNHEIELLKRLLAITDSFIEEQARLEQHLEAYV